MIVCNMTDSEGAREIRHPSRKMGNFPRDLLQRFIHGRSSFREKMESRKEEEEEEEDIELSLGLSLNGRFGVNPERAKNLIRSSSISNLMMSSEEESRGGVCLDAGGGGYEALTRTCSLPTETEEDWRKRKELQSHRRMEAKRKRLEKMKNVRVVKERIDSEKIIEENGRGVGLVPIRNGELSTPIGAELQPPQGSIASQGSGSSGVSDFESQPTQVPGTNQSTKAGSPAQVRSLPPRVEQKPESRPGPRIDKPVAPKEGNGPVKSMMIDMPCVSTRGDGTNGKRIQGFLYRYRKGEEVKIVCVCHGSFLSPAEFVKHAGGGDVAHPLRHIVVCTSPWPFL